MEDNIEVLVAGEEHIGYVETILETIEKAARLEVQVSPNVPLNM